MSKKIKEANPIKRVRNPNSPEAIQARIDGREDPTPFEQLHIINENTASKIVIDLTKTSTDQRIGYILEGGNKQRTKRWINTAFSKDEEGNQIATHYYADSRNVQWVIIRTYLEEPLDISRFGSGGYRPGAPSGAWRNEGRSTDSLQRSQKLIHVDVPLDPNEDYTKDQPADDQYETSAPSRQYPSDRRF